MSGTPSSGDRHYLDRILALLEIICDGSSPSSYREMGLRTGIPLSTTHRMVALLIEAGLCGRRADGKLVPGGQLVRLGLTSMESIMPLEPYQNLVKRISALTNETVSFGMLAGGMILLIARYERGGRASVVARVGEIIPPHRSAAGKVILAHLGDEQRARILRRAVGSEVPDVLERLRPEFEVVLEQGYAFDHEEFAKGLRCLAMPVFDGSCGLAGAISLSGPVGRVTVERAIGFAPLLKELCRDFRQVGSADSQERMTGPEVNRMAESVVTVQPDEEVLAAGLAAEFLAAAEPALGETAGGKLLGELTAGTDWDAGAVMATLRAGGRS